MKIWNLIQIGLLGATLARAQPYHERAERRDIERDLQRREELARRVEKDRRDVEHERQELRHASWFNAGHESRELRNARERLNRDSDALRALDEQIAHDSRRVY